MEKNRLFAIFIIVFVDLLGFSLVLPLLPYYAQAFGADVFGGLVMAWVAAFVWRRIVVNPDPPLLPRAMQPAFATVLVEEA